MQFISYISTWYFWNPPSTHFLLVVMNRGYLNAPLGAGAKLILSIFAKSFWPSRIFLVVKWHSCSWHGPAVADSTIWHSFSEWISKLNKESNVLHALPCAILSDWQIYVFPLIFIDVWAIKLINGKFEKLLLRYCIQGVAHLCSYHPGSWFRNKFNFRYFLPTPIYSMIAYHWPARQSLQSLLRNVNFNKYMYVSFQNCSTQQQ